MIGKQPCEVGSTGESKRENMQSPLQPEGATSFGQGSVVVKQILDFCEAAGLKQRQHQQNPRLLGV